MKYLFFTFYFLIITSTFIHGQDNKLIYSKQIADAAKKSSEILQKSEAFVSVDFVEIDLEKIPKYEQFTLQFEEQNLSVSKERITIRGVNNFSFVGKNNNNCQILMSVLGDDIQGVIETPASVFSIETIGKNDYAIIKIDQSKLREGCSNMEEIGRSNPAEENSHNLGIESDTADNFQTLKSAITYDCKIRVIVLYTLNAQSSVSGIKNNILTAIDKTNESFVNSNINYRIELAYAGLTNYTETGTTDVDYATSLSRFQIDGDGYMDEVHTLRNRYSADVCVLLVGNSAYCGLAYLYVPENFAFCAVTAGSCATSNFSFGHEIGHLLGCRHDTYVDSDTTPYAYGHGYVNPSNTWRTIMAYPNACGSCPRLQYWSNPNVIYGGVPMGTTATNNTTRVWNEQSNQIMTFRQPENNITFTSSDMPNTQYADLIAKQDITTNGVVTINNGNTINMRAGGSITLDPGFSVELGAEFSATNEDIHDCGINSSLEDQTYLTKISIKERPCETLKYVGKIGSDFDAALDSLRKLKNIPLEIDKALLEVLFDYDNREFYGIAYADCAMYSDVLDTKGNYYSRSWYCPDER